MIILKKKKQDFSFNTTWMLEALIVWLDFIQFDNSV